MKKTRSQLKTENEKLKSDNRVLDATVGRMRTSYDDMKTERDMYRGLLHRALSDFQKIRKAQKATMPSEQWSIEVDIAFALSHKTMESGS